MDSKKLDNIKEDMKAKQIEVIKAAVKMTYEILEDMEKKKNIIQNQIKLLRHDLFDLKDGRIDRILERQEINEEDMKAISVLFVEKVNPQAPSATVVSPWYVDYNMKVIQDGQTLEAKVNNSITKTHASGTYKLKNGVIRYL